MTVQTTLACSDLTMKFLTKQLTLHGYRYRAICEEMKVIISFEDVVRIVIQIRKVSYLVETVSYADNVDVKRLNNKQSN